MLDNMPRGTIVIEELEIEAIEVKIFSPSTGKIIYQWNDKYGYWDGMTNSGIRATEGPYFYQMILKKDGREIPKQGTITLTKLWYIQKQTTS